MKEHAFRRGIGLVVLASLLPLAGCIVYSDDTRYGDKGKAPTDRTLDQIQTGTTTKDWVLTTLGEPSRQSTSKEGTEVLEYQYSRKKDNTFIFCPFVFINDEGEDKQTLYFEVENGVITRFWKETSKT
ncbi:MAG: outer membrane protein assembly factor BamE [Planctomycetes bacterium]|nr:outer membrane protein assembly factor BamE [Planctomycetota bacterium]